MVLLAAAPDATSVIQPSVRAADHERRESVTSQRFSRLKSRTAVGSRGSSPRYSMVCVQPGVNVEQMAGHHLAREARHVSPIARRPARRCGGRASRSSDVGHPRFAALTGFVEQPQRARVALALFDHRPGQRAEESFDVGLAHQQIERQLGDERLHVGAALGPAPLARFPNERRAQHVGIVRGCHIGQATAFALGFAAPACSTSTVWLPAEFTVHSSTDYPPHPVAVSRCPPGR